MKVRALERMQQSGAFTPEIQWRHYAENAVAPLCRKSGGAITPKICWRLYAENGMAPIRRKFTADPTHVRFFHPQTFKFFCRPYPDMGPYFPLIVSESADNIFADLQPVGAGREMASEEELARFFD